MGKGCKVVVCGFASVGKTAILEQLLYRNHSVGAELNETQEDIYVASVETDRGVREQLRLYDTRGLRDGQDLPKHYFSVADGFVLVYSVDSLESFKKVDLLKKEIDKSRDKKEVKRRTTVKTFVTILYRAKSITTQYISAQYMFSDSGFLRKVKYIDWLLFGDALKGFFYVFYTNDYALNIYSSVKNKESTSVSESVSLILLFIGLYLSKMNIV
uniref:NFKB inhibitor interacting Ras-like 1 n=1 Tax=Astyanax mexicanus TaxID=7994 RepID=A0A8B9H475_ASTMX